MKVWVTKYALTKGIMEKEAELCDNTDGRMIRIKDNPYNEYYAGGEWFHTKEEAVQKAEELKVKKIKSVKKQLEKLQNLKFD